MRSALVLVLALISSSSAFAGESDLNLFSALTAAGVQGEPGMSRIVNSVSDLSCSLTNASNAITCTMIDESIGADRRQLTVSGPLQNGNVIANAVTVISVALEAANMPSDSSAGHTNITASSVICSQFSAGAADGSLADRTVCRIEAAPSNQEN